MQIHRFNKKPTNTEIFKVWNAAKSMGEIPKRATYKKNGRVEQVWVGWVLMYVD